MIELMVVVVIAAILMTVAVPMFESGLERNRRLAALEATVSMIAHGRSEAVARATPLTLCASNDGVTCDGDWEDGALLFEDDGAGTGTAGDRLMTGDEELVRAFGSAGPNVTITSRGNFDTPRSIVFDELGAVADAGTLAICDAAGLEGAVAVVLNASGQARLATDENDSGVVNIDDRTDLGACP